MRPALDTGWPRPGPGRGQLVPYAVTAPVSVADLLDRAGLTPDEVEHFVPGQPGGHGPVVDHQAERGDDHHVPPERDVPGVERRRRGGFAAVLALPGDDAHADQVDRQPLRRPP